MESDGHASGQQLRPDRQVHLTLQPDVDAEADPDKAPNQQAGHELAAPGDGGGVEGAVEVVRLAGDVEGEVRVHVLVGAKVQDEDAAQEGHHGRVLG